MVKWIVSACSLHIGRGEDGRVEGGDEMDALAEERRTQQKRTFQAQTCRVRCKDSTETADWRMKECFVIVVPDVAARGRDVPQYDSDVAVDRMDVRTSHCILGVMSRWRERRDCPTPRWHLQKVTPV